MSGGIPSLFRRSTSLAVAGMLLAVLAACTGRGGGYLPPDDDFSGRASFAFSFTCEDKGGTNPPAGRLRIQLAYHDHGGNPLGGPFGIHGIDDSIDPVVESMFCIGRNPPVGGNELIFVGGYRPTSSPPPDFPASCRAREKKNTLCRFEVLVRDNDGNRAASQGDYFSIKLSSATAIDDEAPGPVVYARAGNVEGGNITVK